MVVAVVVVVVAVMVVVVGAGTSAQQRTACRDTLSPRTEYLLSSPWHSLSRTFMPFPADVRWPPTHSELVQI